MTCMFKDNHMIMQTASQRMTVVLDYVSKGFALTGIAQLAMHTAHVASYTDT